MGQYRTCEVCKKDFYRPPIYWRTKRPIQTCSRTCRAVLQTRDRVERTCEQCGKHFHVRHDFIAKGFGRFCSKRCNGLADRTRVTIRCRRCNCQFEASTYYLNSDKLPSYCCLECWIDCPKKYGIPFRTNLFRSFQIKKWRGEQCVRCGSTKKLALDHILPRFAGGMNTEENAQTLCMPCNRKKFWEEDLPKYLGHRSAHSKRKRRLVRPPNDHFLRTSSFRAA